MAMTCPRVSPRNIPTSQCEFNGQSEKSYVNLNWGYAWIQWKVMVWCFSVWMFQSREGHNVSLLCVNRKGVAIEVPGTCTSSVCMDCFETCRGWKWKALESSRSHPPCGSARSWGSRSSRSYGWISPLRVLASATDCWLQWLLENVNLWDFINNGGMIELY